jgi:anti-sigma B factor antagonist
MEVIISRFDEITVAVLNGELDSRTSAEVQEKVLTVVGPGSRLLLDMRGVHYISSTGLRTLLMIYRQITNRDGRVVLAGLSEAQKELMSITGFLEFFAAYDTFEEGLTALRGD